MEKNKLLIFSDLHIKEDWQSQLDEIKRIISENGKDSLVIFSGDTLDKPALLGSHLNLHLNQLVNFLDLLITENFIKMAIFLQGTSSHDGFWLKVYKENYPNITFIEDITVKEIFGEKFLFVPELYHKTKEYYKILFSEKYDYIIGHGTVAGYFTSGERDETVERTLLSAPVFDKNDFNANYTIFGHYHNFCFEETANTKFIYVGSFSTNTFGEIDTLNGKAAILIENNSFTRIKNEQDYEYHEIWIRNIDDITLCLNLQNENKRVRGIISDDTLPSYIRTSINTIRNIKDIRTRKNFEENSNNISKEKNIILDEKNDFFEKILVTFENKGLLSAILLFSEEKKIDNIEEKFLVEIQSKIL